ncbi:phage tail tape measure protein [Enterococcus sp. BWM-S5]|uniref:Phage tail tape measure protein n=1 Tax=Enterococcus larvae TaxID=2794352 RepID=A0ABS4CFX2_9ENTE|nr:phage tail tape measure protein [Enterococcus larvae]MBP1044842.1 phage tail tape measure protein [Enterococcus larvae]
MASGNLGVLSAKVALDTIDFNKNITALKRELKVAKSEAQLASKGITGFGTSTSSSSAQLGALTKQINLQQQALGVYDQRYREAIATQGEGSRAAQLAAQSYNETALSIQELQRQHDLLNAQINYQNSGWRRVGEGMESAGNTMTKVGDGMISVGKKWSIAGAAVGGVMTLGAKAAIDYENSFADVTKTVDGTAEELNALSDGIRAMSERVPTSAADLAQLAATAGQLGIKTPEIESFTETIAKLGTATNLAGEQGASQLAKFVNVTLPKGAVAEYDRLGSSIVALGNSYSTTEADIMNMAMRLGAAGSQVGMSQSDILGLSAALSSVGLEAEAGGSAISKALINMQLAAETGAGAFNELEQIASANGVTMEQVSAAFHAGGKEAQNLSNYLGLGKKGMSEMYKSAADAEGKLRDFADVAGMSGEQFAQAFKDDATGALGAFIQGLSTAEERGTSAIKVLDDMGITEVRLRDSLLRASNASELFAGAVDLSNTAWKENNALNAEAENKFATTANQIELAKNKINNLAITFGNELLPVIADTLEKSGPLIQSIKDMIQKFADAKPETKQFALGLTGIVVAGGPVLTFLGGLTKGLGGIITGTGKAVQWVGRARSGLLGLESAGSAASAATVTTANSVAGATGSMSLFAKAAVWATSGVTGATGALGLLTSPLGIAAGALVVGTAVWKLWGEEAWNSSQRVNRWGFDVGEEMDKTLLEVQGFSTDSMVAMQGFELGIDGSAEKVINSFRDMQEQIKETAAETNEAIQEMADALPEHLQESAQKNAETQKAMTDEVVEATGRMADQVASIYERHKNDTSKFTAEEKALVLSNRQSMIEAELNLLKISGKEKESILNGMNSNVQKMTQQQLENFTGSIGNALRKQTESYKEQVEQITEAKDAGLISAAEYSQEMSRLEASNVAMTEELGQKYAQALRAMGYDTAQIEAVFKQHGLNYQEISSKAIAASSDFEEASTILATSTEHMTQEAILGNEKWNSLVYDEKTGTLKTNVNEVIMEAAQSESGWNDIEYILKHAELNTNAHETVSIALGESGKWNEMTVEQKMLSVDNDVAMMKTLDAIAETGNWNNFKILEKELGMENSDLILKLLGSEEALQHFNSLTPTQKELLANNSDLESKISSSKATYNAWENIPDSIKNIYLQADTSGATSAQNAINSVNGKTVYIDVITREQYVRGPGGKSLEVNEKGTNYHPGGNMLVNDQSGSLYREAVRFPGGDWFVPQGRNVYIDDAPLGTQVMPAGMTRAKFKNYEYESGTGVNAGMLQPIPFKKLSAMGTQDDQQTTTKNTTITSKPVFNFNFDNIHIHSDDDINRLSEKLAENTERRLRGRLA